MKIEDIAKNMTRKEFLEKADTEKHCPSYYSLENTTMIPNCLRQNLCHQCFEEAIKDIKFKGEDEMNKKLWDEFLAGKVVVNCQTLEDAKEFLNYCNKQGIRWVGNKLLSRDQWNNYREETCYSKAAGGMCFSPIRYYKEINQEIITYKELKSHDEVKTYKTYDIINNCSEFKDKQFKCVKTAFTRDDLKVGDIARVGLFGLYEKFYAMSINHVRIKDLIGNEEWELVPQYMYFGEARKSGKMFRYKTWTDFKDLKAVMNALRREQDINKMLDENAWEVEE